MSRPEKYGIIHRKRFGGWKVFARIPGQYLVKRIGSAETRAEAEQMVHDYYAREPQRSMDTYRYDVETGERTPAEKPIPDYD